MDANYSGDDWQALPMKTREEAISFIYKVIKNPMGLLSIPMRREADALALKFEITAHEVLEYALSYTRKL